MTYIICYLLIRFLSSNLQCPVWFLLYIIYCNLYLFFLITIPSMGNQIKCYTPILIDSWNIIWYCSSHIYYILLSLHDLLLRVGTIPYHLLNKSVVYKHIKVGCSVTFPNIDMKIILYFQTINIDKSWLIFIHRRYFIYLGIWGLSCIQIWLLGVNLNIFSKIWKFQCKRVYFFPFKWFLKQPLELLGIICLHIESILPRLK